MTGTGTTGSNNTTTTTRSCLAVLTDANASLSMVVIIGQILKIRFYLSWYFGIQC